MIKKPKILVHYLLPCIQWVIVFFVKWHDYCFSLHKFFLILYLTMKYGQMVRVPLTAYFKIDYDAE